MNKSLIALSLGAATFAAVTLYPADDSGAVPTVGRLASPPQPPLALAEAPAPRIEVVFVLDTTGSMSGLLEAAKDKIWAIASSMAQADPAPEIRVGLVAYRDRGDAYITRHVNLSSDLDSVYSNLMDLRAEGGGDHREAVNQALDEAVERMAWSDSEDVYRVVFLVGDAPPHMDYQGESLYPDIVARANQRGIVVNTIQCGSNGATAQTWRHIASLSQGDFFNVAQDGSAVAIATPFDETLAKLSAEMDKTRLFFGDDETLARLEKKHEATARLHAAASPAVLARRATFNASASGDANLAGDADLVAAVGSGRVAVEEVDTAALPEVMREMDVEARKRHVAEQARARAELKSRITEIAGKRDAFIAEKLKDSGDAEDSFGARVYDTIRRQSADIGLEYEAEVRH